MKFRSVFEADGLRQINLTANEIISRLLAHAVGEGLCILDSCGADRTGKNLLIAGMRPARVCSVQGQGTAETLSLLDTFAGEKAAIFTLSYDLGAKLNGLDGKSDLDEPDLFIAEFDGLLIYDYLREKASVTGAFDELCSALDGPMQPAADRQSYQRPLEVTSNFIRAEYLSKVENIKELIRSGDTYQTNLTQQISVELPQPVGPARFFERLRRRQPAPFTAYIERGASTVISASPERFFRVEGSHISASPIKGTRPRGRTAAEDRRLAAELSASEKDRAENTMIVDLIRNDLGRICEYGSVEVTELCRLQELPSVFHLESTVCGRLRRSTRPSQIIAALFPCGSITGAPKISTIEIIDRLETVPRGLSMGAIGVYIPQGPAGAGPTLDLSVAIRTMVVRGPTATFNVGGGVTIDSDPEAEYEESWVKAKALLDSMGARRPERSF